MSFRIISDSSCDIWSLDDIDFVTVPLTLSTNEKSFVDDETLDVHELLTYLAQFKGRSYTACPPVGGWTQCFEGVDEIYITTITSGLSGTYNSALNAKELYQETHPDVKIHVFDSLSTSSELLLITEKIAELKKAGLSFEEVCEQVEAYKKTTRLIFTLKSLHNLAQNGRVPKLLAQALGVFNITVIGTASEAGTIEPIGKSRGKNAVVSTLIKELKTAGYKGGKLRIAHVENPEMAELFSAAIRREFPDVQPEIRPTRGLVSYYAELGSILVGFEC